MLRVVQSTSVVACYSNLRSMKRVCTVVMKTLRKLQVLCLLCFNVLLCVRFVGFMCVGVVCVCVCCIAFRPHLLIEVCVCHACVFCCVVMCLCFVALRLGRILSIALCVGDACVFWSCVVL